MSEPARNVCRLAADFRDRAAGLLANALMELFESVPGDRRFECVGDDA
jgi:hypothetical protein